LAQLIQWQSSKFRSLAEISAGHEKLWSQLHIWIIYCKTLNFGVGVNSIILDPVILAFLLPITLKRYCIKIFANLPGLRNSRNKGHVKKTGFTV